VPILLGICFGSYASFLARGGGPASYGQLALALISGVALAVLIFVVNWFRKALPRGPRAGAYGALVGGSVGFLYSLTGHSLLLAGAIGLATGLGTMLSAFYLFYMTDP
jgi:hypothetical protein